LRSQLNPHFFFNTLHSIAELVHQSPKLAETLILRLGELLRQVLRSATLPDVPLGEELDPAKPTKSSPTSSTVTWECNPHPIRTLEARHGPHRLSGARQPEASLLRGVTVLSGSAPFPDAALPAPLAPLSR
jgi:hypothetical protein